MTVPTIIGNENGIRLWNIMATSDDAEEQTYFARLNIAASKHGKVWFSDYITQREAKQNQVTWMLTWNNIKTQWEMSIFLKPSSGALEITKRMQQSKVNYVNKVIELNIDDLLIDDEE